jgi:hypothetical protein
MSRRSVWPAVVLLALVAVVATPLPHAGAQPPAGTASPLDLVKGLRENGMPDLALEYLRELESQPGLPADLKAVIPLERAKSQLEAAEDEPDEAARAALVAEATIGFNQFLRNSPNHPRGAEAAIALARLKSIEAKAQLIRSRRIDVPREDGPERTAAVDRKQKEAAKARPLFLEAAGLFKKGSDKLDDQLKRMDLDPASRKALEQEQLDAELARGINTYALGDTYDPDAAAKEKIERGKHLEEARKVFLDLSKKPNSGRAGWVARAWAAECEYALGRPKEGEKEFEAILKAGPPEAEDGRRMVQFFQLRRTYEEAFAGGGDQKKLDEAEKLTKAWLDAHGANRRARAEATATRYYRARVLQQQAYLLSPPPKDPRQPYKPNTSAELKLKDAERLYRTIRESDNEYTDRATRNRMTVVRQLIGDAEKSLAEYKTFEDCQMAAIIQIAKLLDEEKQMADPAWAEAAARRATALGGGGGAESIDWPTVARSVLAARRLKIVALLERARTLATDKDNPSDVVDVLLQLIYYYELTDQPYEAAILGEYVTRYVKATGGKLSDAGAMSLQAYTISSAKIPPGPDLEATRKIDRARAIRLARFIDQKFPNDRSADMARYRLGALLFEDGDLLGAYDALVRVRPGFTGAVYARLYQGAIVARLVTDARYTDESSPDFIARDRRVAMFRQTVDDLDKLTPPSPTAEASVVRGYYSARVRMAGLLLLQPRVDPDGWEKTNPGYKRAQDVADELNKAVRSFAAFVEGDKLTLDGWEAKLLAEDVRTRAAFLRATQSLARTDYEEVFKVIGPIITEMTNQGPFAEQVKDVPGDDDRKSRVTTLADAVDKMRREQIIVIALKTRVRQGNPKGAIDLIGLLRTFGGNIEKNLPVLEQLTRELVAQIRALRREGKADEAKRLADGFALFLDEVAKEPNLSPALLLYVGQSLVAVEDYPRAVPILQKIPKVRDEWLRPDGYAKLEDAQRQETNRYRGACLYLIRAYRGAGQFEPCEAKLKEVLGVGDLMDVLKQQPQAGWAFTSLEFRKEVALYWEARGAAEPNPATARDHYGRALQVWTSLYNIAKRRLEETPKEDNAALQRNKNAFYDAFFDIQRCVIKANQKLQAAAPDKLAKTMDDVSKRFLQVEQIMGDDLAPEVWNRYADLLDETPQLKEAYKKNGGVKFLTRPATGP